MLKEYNSRKGKNMDNLYTPGTKISYFYSGEFLKDGLISVGKASSTRTIVVSELTEKHEMHDMVFESIREELLEQYKDKKGGGLKLSDLSFNITCVTEPLKTYHHEMYDTNFNRARTMMPGTMDSDIKNRKANLYAVKHSPWNNGWDQELFDECIRGKKDV